MSTNRPSDDSNHFYDRNADDFTSRTVDLDMSALYEPFLKRLAPGARILDAGCGPGRDLSAFTNLGFAVVGIDASREMIAQARARSGAEVHQLRFQDVAFDGEFDAVWACASLLHVPRAELPDVFKRLAWAMKPGGVWYLSFKYGQSEREKDGRHFTDLDESALAELVGELPDVEIVESWRTWDVRPERSHEAWLNAILVKQPS